MQLLSNYSEWRNCIEHNCGIPLTKQFVEQRFNMLEDKTDKSTIEFINKYGENYYALIISFFKKALHDATA